MQKTFPPLSSTAEPPILASTVSRFPVESQVDRTLFWFADLFPRFVSIKFKITSLSCFSYKMPSWILISWSFIYLNLFSSAGLNLLTLSSSCLILSSIYSFLSTFSLANSFSMFFHFSESCWILAQEGDSVEKESTILMEFWLLAGILPRRLGFVKIHYLDYN